MTESCPTMMELERLGEFPDEVNPMADHVRSCPSCRETLEDIRANDALLRKMSQAGLNSFSDNRVGDSLPRRKFPKVEGYAILDEIERGGQGVVYRAKQIATNRIVALKVLLAGAFATSQQRRRFEREIELVASLEHPNIVTVYDSGVMSDEGHYFAMRHVEGVPLDHWLRTRRSELSRNDILALFLSICDGVSYAHQRGVIHRDLKPANILVDKEGRPYILDFGLARPVDNAEPQVRTVEGAFLGTLAYASPEQTLGKPELIDVRSDVYALGVILYEMLTDTFPYPIEGPPGEVLRHIAHREPLRPSARLRQIRPPGGIKINDELDTIVLKTLAKDRDRRYQSGAALRDDLRRYLDGDPVEAKRDSGLYVLKKTVIRYRWPLAASSLFVMVLLGFTAALIGQNKRTLIEVDKLKQTNLFLEDTFGSVQPATGKGEVTVRAMLDEAVLWVDIALSDQPEVAASIENTIGNGYRGLGLFDRAETMLESALARRRALFGDHHLQVAQSMNALGLLRRGQGRLEEATRLIGDSLRLRIELLGPNAYEVSLSLSNLALVKRDQGDHDEAAKLLNEALRVRIKLFGPVHQDVAMTTHTIGTIAEARGNPAAALQHYQQALKMRRTILHRHHPDLARSLETVARMLIAQGQPKEALPLLQECLALRHETLGPDHELTRKILASLNRLRDGNQNAE